MTPEDAADVLLELAWAWNRGSSFDPERAQCALAQMMAAGNAADACSSVRVKASVAVGFGRMLLQAGINRDFDGPAVWAAAADQFEYGLRLFGDLNDVLPYF